MEVLTKLSERLKNSVDFAVENKEDMYRVSWNYQEGVLISYNEAKLIIDLVNQQRELFVAMFDKMTNDDIQECTNGFSERVFNRLSNQ